MFLLHMQRTHAQHVFIKWARDLSRSSGSPHIMSCMSLVTSINVSRERERDHGSLIHLYKLLLWAAIKIDKRYPISLFLIHSHTLCLPLSLSLSLSHTHTPYVIMGGGRERERERDRSWIFDTFI